MRKPLACCLVLGLACAVLPVLGRGEEEKGMKLVEQAATNTLPKLLARNALTHPRQPGIREKDRGIWKTYSWRDCQTHVQAIALGLAANGFGRGDKLSVTAISVIGRPP